MCGCQLSLYSNIALEPAPTAGRREPSDALVIGTDIHDVPPLDVQPGDWTSYRGDNSRSDVTRVNIPAGVQLDWQLRVSPHGFPTAPVTAGNMVFIADRSGAVSAFDREGKRIWKTLDQFARTF